MSSAGGRRSLTRSDTSTRTTSAMITVSPAVSAMEPDADTCSIRGAMPANPFTAIGNGRYAVNGIVLDLNVMLVEHGTSTIVAIPNQLPLPGADALPTSRKLGRTLVATCERCKTQAHPHSRRAARPMKSSPTVPAA